jgi:hypothetical protein
VPVAVHRLELAAGLGNGADRKEGDGARESVSGETEFACVPGVNGLVHRLEQLGTFEQEQGDEPAEKPSLPLTHLLERCDQFCGRPG